MIRPFEGSMDILVKTYDVDFAGIVNNTVYVGWLDDLRQIVLDSPLPLQPLMEEHNAAPIVLETRITYHKALRLFDQDVRAVMWVHAMDGVFFTTHSHILRGEELIAEAVQRNAIVRMGRSLTPMRLPRSFRDAFKAYDYDPALTVSQSHF